MVVCKMEAQSERVHVAVHVLLRVSAPTRMPWSVLSDKFVHRSSGESLLRLHCWLGLFELLVQCSTLNSATVISATRLIVQYFGVPF